MADDNQLSIKLRNQEGNELTFKIRNNTPFQKVFNAYCQRMGLDQEMLKFVDPEGQRIRAEQTPEQLALEDGDEIQVMMQQVGGH